MAIRLLAALCALIMLIGGAYAETAYRSGGGFVAQAENGDLYIADSAGIARASSGGAVRIADGNAGQMQIAGDMLYYADTAWDENGNRAVSIRRIDLQTGENTEVAPPLPAGVDYEYDPNYF